MAKEPAIHQQLTLELNADVAEWCPLPHPHSRLLAAGTYQLNEATQQREGRLYIYQLIGDITHGSQLSLQLLNTIDMPGIFDLQWLPFTEEPTIAAALADGTLKLFQITVISTKECKISEISSIDSPEEGGMALSVEYQHSSQKLVSSYSDGQIAVFQVLFLFLII